MGKNKLSESEGIQAKRFKESKEFKKEGEKDKEEERVKKKINDYYILMEESVLNIKDTYNKAI